MSSRHEHEGGSTLSSLKVIVWVTASSLAVASSSLISLLPAGQPPGGGVLSGGGGALEGLLSALSAHTGYGQRGPACRLCPVPCWEGQGLGPQSPMMPVQCLPTLCARGPATLLSKAALPTGNSLRT